MSDINTPMGVIVCPQCSLPKLAGVYGYAGPQCQCWHPTPQPTLDVAGKLLQQSEEIRRLRAELAASREREARMQWQPIETAPTDGTRILLRGRNGKIADGHYGQPDGFANPKRFVWPYINATPTHWAPLAFIAAAAELLAAAMKVNALSIQTDAHKELRAAIANATGDDDAAPECTCAAKDMTFGRCCKVTPNDQVQP